MDGGEIVRIGVVHGLPEKKAVITELGYVGKFILTGFAPRTLPKLIVISDRFLAGENVIIYVNYLSSFALVAHHCI